MGLGMDMGRDELLEDRAAFIAGEIGGAVVELIIGGIVISQDAIVDSLEAKRKSVAGCCGIREERAVDLVNDVTAGRPAYQW